MQKQMLAVFVSKIRFKLRYNGIIINNECLLGYLFVMSRTPVVSSVTQQQIDAVLDRYQIDITQLRALNIASCPASLTQSTDGGLLGLIGGLLGAVLGAVGSILG